MFTLCHRKYVTVCRLSVTLVHGMQRVQLFTNTFAASISIGTRQFVSKLWEYIKRGLHDCANEMAFGYKKLAFIDHLTKFLKLYNNQKPMK